ncbi:J domain-containing protein [Acidisoma cladoniae]|uniref:J domain-containing protein n=1 Tax=Acidisoma cladoniae TaxID=3040935 RepID=UPI00254E7B75|nr:J domain-containing protein [Acidisoma sp. PAMC 29798]
MTTRRVPRARAYAPDPDAPGRLCDMPDCSALGCYKAPRSRTSLNEYLWLCLEHVRAYNASWDYYKDMTPGQIEVELRADASWQRPTWRLGANGGPRLPDEAILRDPFLDLAGRRTGSAEPAADHAPQELRQPLAVLGLGWPVSLDVVKARYKTLAKKHHPDANGGGNAAEEQIKAINIAYATLRTLWPAEERQMARS